MLSGSGEQVSLIPIERANCLPKKNACYLYAFQESLKFELMKNDKRFYKNAYFT